VLQVRVVFDGLSAHRAAKAAPDSSATDEAALEDRSEEVLEALEAVVDEQSVEINQVTR
jgi:hypothetical protein